MRTARAIGAISALLSTKKNPGEDHGGESIFGRRAPGKELESPNCEKTLDSIEVGAIAPLAFRAVEAKEIRPASKA
jgi:hypothetical protein